MTVSQQERNVMEQFFSKGFFIFGAGMVGSLAAKYIKEEYNVVPKAFLVSNSEFSENEIDGIRVRNIDLIEDKEIQILVALLQWSQPEIINYLDGLGFRNVKGISEAEFQIMRKRIVPYKDEFASQRYRLSELIGEKKETELRTLVVSDFGLPEVFKWNKVSIVKSQDFLSEQYDAVDTIILFMIDWNNEVEKIVEKSCLLGAKTHISMRSRYAESNRWDFVEFIKKLGYQISAYKRFSRPIYEYDTEDLLITIERRNEFSLKNDLLCTGCGKCEKECERGAIHMKEDECGYEKPFIDETLCIHCKKCIKNCPVYHKRNYSSDKKPICLAFMAEDNIREVSSSGGAFSVLAEYAIDQGATVCGAAWTDNFSVRHIVVNNKSDLTLLRRSKYVKSDIGNVYEEILDKSKQGEKCLFFGCPCQVAAIKAYLGNLSDNILFIDLICTQAPSYRIFRKYLEDNYTIDDLRDIGFREKSEGWRPDSFYFIDKDGAENIKHWDDSFQRAYHSKLMMPVHCEKCAFSGMERVGDITIGDFWGINECDASMDDGKGTSVILLNSEKGKTYLDFFRENAKNIKMEPLEWVIKYNRFGNNIKPHIGRDRFYDGIRAGHTYNKIVSSAMNNNFDIALVGNWSFPNYGTELTYYALYAVLKNLGYTVSLIEWPEDSPWKPYGSAQLFRVEPYRNYEMNEKAISIFDMQKYNKISDCFMHGSDQLLSPVHFYTLQESAIMSWVNPGRRKLAYAYSFGKDIVNYENEVEKRIGIYLRNFDGISVRERTALDIMREKFQIETDMVLDPVFLCDMERYEKLCDEKINIEGMGNYVFAYILDFTEEKLCKVKEIASDLHMDVVIVKDAERDLISSETSNCIIVSDVSLNEWLTYIRNCSYMITDSFHGTCMAIVFKKQFISIVNRYRGATRFHSIAEIFGVQSRMVNSFEYINAERISVSIDYSVIEEILHRERDSSIKWIVDSVESPSKNTLTDMEVILFERCSRLEAELEKRKFSHRN